MGLQRATGMLDSKLSSAHIRMAKSASDLPCANAREDVVKCFSKNTSTGLECKVQVESFTACARRVSAMKESGK